jgi:hypothetical protein
LAVQRQKAFEFAESFLKIDKIATGRLSKEVGAVLPAFQKRIVHWQPLFAGHLSFSRSKGFEIAGFEKLAANSKAFGAKRPRT